MEQFISKHRTLQELGGVQRVTVKRIHDVTGTLAALDLEHKATLR